MLVDVSQDLVLRVRTGNQVGSGVLLDPTTALGCAHVLRGASWAHVTGPTRARVRAWRVIEGTDIAVMRLSTPLDCPHPWLLSSTTPKLFEPLVTFGFGGGPFLPKPGRLVATLPFSIGRNRLTKVRHAGLVAAWPKARRGDSGGPVIAGNRIVGVQSMILDFGPWNTGIATIALVGPHYRAIERARREL